MQSNKTTGSDQRSAIGGSQPKYGFPVSQLDQVTRNLENFTLIDGNGQIWTSYPDGKAAHRTLTQAVQQVQPEAVSG